MRSPALRAKARFRARARIVRSVNVAVFTNSLGIGGTEKAACRWARGLQERGHAVAVLSLQDGPRRSELEQTGVAVRVVPTHPDSMAAALQAVNPDAVHAHAPGYPHEGDMLGTALSRLKKRIPVVQTNIFGRLENPAEDRWTDFRLFISWTSCVQAARRSFRHLDEAFFRRASVAVYPLDPDDGADPVQITEFRERHGVKPDEILFGRLSRPEPNKWTNLPINAFRMALRKNPRLKLLLREPPPAVAQGLATGPDRDRFLILQATSDPDELRRTMSSLDVVLHTSSIGESFGYGIAEPMNLGKPVIANSTPWADQAQVEWVRHCECGFLAATPSVMAEAMLTLAADSALRTKFGRAAQRHIRAAALPAESLDRMEGALQAAVAGRDTPWLGADLAKAAQTAAYLDAHQFGHSLEEQFAIRPLHYRVRFHQWRKTFHFASSASAAGCE